MGFLDPIKRYLTAIKLIGVGLLLAAIAYQHFTIGNLRDWRDSVIVATAHAVDSRPEAGKPKPAVKAKDVVGWINTLGNFRRDVLTARATAKVSDLTHKIAVAGEVKTISKEVVDDYQSKQAAADVRAANLIALARAGRMQHGGRSAAIANSGGRGEAHLSGLSGDPARADDPPAPDGLPQPGPSDPVCPDPTIIAELTIKERREATGYALQLDALITELERLGEIDFTGEQPEQGAQNP